MELQDVTMPDGTVITDVPVGTTKAELMAKLNGGAPQAPVAPPEPIAAPQQPTLPRSITSGPAPSMEAAQGASDWMQQNMDVPAGLAGALTGARMGAGAGPQAAIAGGILGGAVGTFGGSLASDALQGEDLDYANAVKESLMSVGVDVAFLGAGKAITPIIKAMRAGGKSVEDAAVFFKSAGLGQQAGSSSSLKATQAILQPGGATLTPYQTNVAAGYQNIGEQLARTGIFSQQVMAQNLQNVNNVINSKLSDIVAGGGRSPDVLGEEIYSVIAAGKHALQQGYSEGLDTVSKLLGNKPVSLVPMNNFLTRTLKNASRNNGMFSTLDDSVVGLVRKYQNMLEGNPQIGARGLIDLEKKFMQEARDLTTNESGVLNKAVDQQVSQLIEGFQKSNTMALKKANPEAALEYRAINKQYSEGMAAMLPDLNKSFVAAATKGDYTRLGQLLMNNGNVNRINRMMGSIDAAYKQMARVRGPVKPSLAIPTAEQAKAAIRQSYIQELFPKLGPEFDIGAYAKLADRFESGQDMARLAAVMGPKDAKYVKQLMNAMKEASKTPGSNIGELMLRAKEYGAIGGLGLSVIAGNPSLTAAAASILFLPRGLAKIATNPVRVNKLLAFGKRKFPDEQAMYMAFTNMFSEEIAEATIDSVFGEDE